MPDKTLAQLADGTPLVTAMRMGKGMTILFHVTADTTWSNLPLSGLFVDMLRKIVDLVGTDSAERCRGGRAGAAQGGDANKAASVAAGRRAGESGRADENP